jgi:hypothetical protein
LGGTFSTVLVFGKFFYVTFDLVLFADLVDLRLTFDLIDSSELSLPRWLSLTTLLFLRLPSLISSSSS